MFQDFVAGAFWAFFWFVSSCAQAAALTGIKDATNAEDLARDLDYCKNGFSCEVQKKAKYATLTVSVVSKCYFIIVLCFVWWPLYTGNLENAWNFKNGLGNLGSCKNSWKNMEKLFSKFCRV